MNMGFLHQICRRVATIATATLALAGSAHATLVVGTWDPTYGTPFGNLGWKGQVVADVPPACLTAGFYPADITCPGITVSSALVDFYDINTPNSTVETLNFTSTLALTAVGLEGANDAQGFRGMSGWETSTSSLADFNGANAQFQLVLDFYADGSVVPTARLNWRVGDGECARIFGTRPYDYVADCTGSNNGFDFPPEFRFTTTQQVPEPAGFALLGAGLLAAGLGRRLRRARRQG